MSLNDMLWILSLTETQPQLVNETRHQLRNTLRCVERSTKQPHKNMLNAE